jgi:leader peptidase (prepilin peptidase) / N-methyltransferase
LGLALGSFLNCAAYRLEVGESFLAGRSYCPECKHKLCWQDLVPLFSFVFLGARCRYCQKPISFRYPLVEISTAIIFLLIFNFQFPISGGFPIFDLQNILATIYLLISASLLIIIFIFDLKHYIIPDGAVFAAMAISGLWSLFFGQILNALGAAAAAALFFLLIFLISRGKWMGFGDVKLAFFMGLFLGFPKIIAALFLAFFIGAIIGICLIIFGKKKFSSEVPFGPFLIIGTFLALLSGENLINWYLGLISLSH